MINFPKNYRNENYFHPLVKLKNIKKNSNIGDKNVRKQKFLYLVGQPFWKETWIQQSKFYMHQDCSKVYIQNVPDNIDCNRKTLIKYSWQDTD